MPLLPEVAPQAAPVLPKTPWLKVVLVTLSGIFLAIVVFTFGYWLSGKKYLKVNPPSATQTPSSDLKTFTGQKLGMSFDYPAAWGEAQEKVDMIGTPEQYHGHTYNLTFSNNPYLTFMGASKDSSSPGVGGACPIRFLFNGTKETGMLSCSQCNPANEGCVGCSEAAIAEQPAVSYFYIPSAYCALVGFQKVIYLKTPYNSSANDFPGLVLTLNMVTNINGQLASSGDYSTARCPNESDEEKKSHDDQLINFNSICQEYKTKFVSGATSDYLSTLELTQLTNLLTSLHFHP